jgi:N-acetylneuraminic acid mutarotase
MKTIINTLKAIIIVALFITLFSEESLGTNVTTLQRYGAVGFSIGTKGYIGTGYGYYTSPYCYRKDFWEYDPSTDSWTQKADFGGTARYDAVGFSVGTKGYIGTGLNDSGFFQDFWEYNPTSNNWVRKADFEGGRRGCAVGFSIGTKGYIGTGQGYSGDSLFLNLNDFWEYNPTTNLWTRKADFISTSRYAAVGFCIGQKGYLGTGINYVNSTTYTWYKDFYEYDPGTDSWTKKADFGGAPRAFDVGFSIGYKGYIGTGSITGTRLNDFWEYDPTNTETGGTWTKKSDFAGAKRGGSVGFSIGTKGYIGTGLNAIGVYYQDFWEYNQSTNVWTQKTDFGNKHKGHLKDATTIGETDQLSDAKLIVYPNPSNSAFNFSLKTTSEELVTIQIFDMLGRLVREYKSLSPDDLMTIGDNLNVGVYVAVVTQGEYRKTVKLSKVN